MEGTRLVDSFCFIRKIDCDEDRDTYITFFFFVQHLPIQPLSRKKANRQNKHIRTSLTDKKFVSFFWFCFWNAERKKTVFLPLIINDGGLTWLPSGSRGNHDAQVATIVVPYEGLVLFSFLFKKLKKKDNRILFKKKIENHFHRSTSSEFLFFFLKWIFAVTN